MNKRPIAFILPFLFLFAVLVGMQVYFLINSYALKKREILEEVRRKLKNLEDDRDIFDDDYLKNKSYLEQFVALDEGRITEDSIRNFYNKRARPVSRRLANYVDGLFLYSGYHVGVKKELTSVYSNNTHRELLNGKITIYESAVSSGEVNYLSSGSWESNYSKSTSETEKIGERVIEDSKVLSYGFLVARNSTFTVSNLYWIVFKELLLFVFASLLILIAILYIFYITYQNLLEQSRQVLVLHDMVDNVSHEMRTPIATLKLTSRNLQKKHEDSNFSVLDRQILRLEKLLEPLSSPGGNPERTDYTYSDMQLFLKDLVISEGKSAVKLSSFPQVAIKVHKLSLETILNNLITNSVKYGASEVDLSIELDAGVLRLKLLDNGQGMDESEFPYIFRKFYRIQKDNIYNSEGLGLGLYIVKQLVDQLKGDIKVKSQLNKGSEFLIILPYGY